MGGAAGFTMLMGMVRIKFAAELIGTTGVGLNASFAAIQTLIGTLAGLGLQSSAVRDIAAAVGKDDQQEIGRKVLTLRRICWITGLIGMVTMMMLSPMISQITFGHQNYALDISALGLLILFANLSGGQMALIQGMRRIGDIARVNVFAGILATIAAISFYGILGLRGIVPALVTASAAQLALSWYFARQVPVPKVPLGIRQTFSEANDMVRLGLMMMFSSLMVSAVTYATVALITQQEGTQAVGLYSAAFALSCIFVNFVLGAMAADYYPRLTGVADDKIAVNRLVNEQTEIGLLLSIPGLIATLALAPWILNFFYTREFLNAVELLQWFVLGCLGRVISWPLGFVILALGERRWFFVTETASNLLHLVLISLGLIWFGLEGVAIAFFVLYLCYVAAVYVLCRHLTGFNWSTDCRRIALYTLPVSLIMFIASRNLSALPSALLAIAATVAIGVFCLRELVRRLGAEHRLVQYIVKIPGVKFVIH
jgi:PST family polysaccharide transporter